MTRFDVIYRKSLLSTIFRKGWGKPDLIARLIENRKVFASPQSFYKFDCAQPITIDKRTESKDTVMMEGSFVSPFDRVFPGVMRDTCNVAKFQMILPRKWKSDLRPVCIHLAGTGDQHYYRRRVFLANRLLKDGIASIILMNPFYGDRKPKDQSMSSLNYVTDLFVMGGGLMLECQALLQWCERNNFGPLALHGISMGGYMASLAASMWPRPISLVPCLSWTTASTVFVDGVLSESICWDVLTKQYLEDKSYGNIIRPMLQPSVPSQFECRELAEDRMLHTLQHAAIMHRPQSQQQRSYSTGPLGRLGQFRYEDLMSQFDRLKGLLTRHPGSSEIFAEMSELQQRLAPRSVPKPSGPLENEVRLFLREMLDVFTHLGNYNVPADPSLIVNVVAEFDSYVPRTGVASLEDVWPGSHIRLLPDIGHIGAYLRSSVWTQDLFRQAIRDSLNLQVEKYMNQPGPF